jgi:hypothetical protein
MKSHATWDMGLGSTGRKRVFGQLEGKVSGFLLQRRGRKLVCWVEMKSTFVGEVGQVIEKFVAHGIELFLVTSQSTPKTIDGLLASVDIFGGIQIDPFEEVLESFLFRKIDGDSLAGFVHEGGQNTPLGFIDVLSGSFGDSSHAFQFRLRPLEAFSYVEKGNEVAADVTDFFLDVTQGDRDLTAGHFRFESVPCVLYRFVGGLLLDSRYERSAHPRRTFNSNRGLDGFQAHDITPLRTFLGPIF